MPRVTPHRVGGAKIRERKKCEREKEVWNTASLPCQELIQQGSA